MSHKEMGWWTRWFIWHCNWSSGRDVELFRKQIANLKLSHFSRSLRRPWICQDSSCRVLTPASPQTANLQPGGTITALSSVLPLKKEWGAVSERENGDQLAVKARRARSGLGDKGRMNQEKKKFNVWVYIWGPIELYSSTVKQNTPSQSWIPGSTKGRSYWAGTKNSFVI